MIDDHTIEGDSSLILAVLCLHSTVVVGFKHFQSKIPLKLGINYIIELRRDSQGGLTDNTIVAVEM